MRIERGHIIVVEQPRLVLLQFRPSLPHNVSERYRNFKVTPPNCGLPSRIKVVINNNMNNLNLKKLKENEH